MTKTRFAILLLILSVSGLLSQESVQKTPVGTVMDIFRSADRCLEKKDYEGARREYEKLAGMETVEHGRYMGLFNIAESYRLEKDYKNAHAAYRKILSDGNLNSGYRVYGLFKEAELYTETKDWRNARRVYEEVKKAGGVSPQHVFRADLLTGESYSSEGRHKEAGGIYERLLKEIDSSSYPHEGWRLDVVDRLELIDGLADGQELKSRRQLWWEKVNSPKYAVYVSLNGNDENTGTMERPFATIKKAQEEVRRIKIEKGLPGGGIAVYLRGGKYFMDESVLFGKDDSGTEDAPVVYRSYPGEEVRLIGGRQLKNFSLLKDPAVLRRLPEESRGKVWVCDLKQEGIRDYGHLSNRGMGGAPSSSMELFYNTRPMQLSRWPDEGWENVAGLATPEGDGKISGYTFQNGKFRYSGDRPERWTEEKEIWTAGYFLWQWNKVHTRVLNIDTKNKIVNLAPYIHHAKSYYAYHMPVVKDTPYYFYNILSEVSSPGEFYIDRETGSLYFYPPGKIEESEVMVSTLKAPVVKIDGGSHIALYGLTVECGWSSGIQVEEGSTNLIAGCVVRNTGGVAVRGGWNHSVAGCDVYNTREGGIRVTGGDGLRLIHGGHHVENNHIYRTENLSHLGGTSGIGMSGSGNRISHNLIHDCTYNGMQFGGSNNVVEYNEIYDVMHEGRDGGAIYTYSAPRSLMNRGNVMRYNFIHHISQHSSPLKTHQVTGLYIDGLAGGMAVLGNTFYRCTERAVFTHGPDTRIEDNMFVDCEVGITQSNRTYLLREERSVRNWEKLTLNLLRHKLPPWSARFPQVKNIFEVTPYGEPRNIVMERNLFSNTPPFKISGDFDYESNSVKNNFENRELFLRDNETMDFNLRPGSPVYAGTGFDGNSFHNAGVYRDNLRASWPVNRGKVGKYYKSGWSAPVEDAMTKFPVLKRISREKEYGAAGSRQGVIVIDGKLHESEWAGLDRKRAMLVDEVNSTGLKTDVRMSAWLQYDTENLYIGVESLPGKKEETAKGFSLLFHEIAVEGGMGTGTSWWQEGVPTSPLYIFTGRVDGRFEVHNIFNAPADVIKKFQTRIEYKSFVIDREIGHWTAEWKMPLALLGINPEKLDRTRFNIGTGGKDGWFSWVATGSSGWRVDVAGVLKFVK